MSLSQTCISILRRLGREDDRLSSPEADVGLLALTDAFLTNDTALRYLLEGDGRDTNDIPAFAALADRQAELVALIASTPAGSLEGLIAKARCARLHPAERGFDAALEINLSLADDLLLIGRLSPSSPPGFLRSGPGTAPPQMRERIMNKDADAGRRAILRRNENWRQFGQALTMVGAAAVVALMILLLNGVDPPWTALAGLTATAAVSIGLSFYVLRFRDYSV